MINIKIWLRTFSLNVKLYFVSFGFLCNEFIAVLNLGERYFNCL